jgi:hypothetical protein
MASLVCLGFQLSAEVMMDTQISLKTWAVDMSQ